MLSVSNLKGFHNIPVWSKYLCVVVGYKNRQDTGSSHMRQYAMFVHNKRTKENVLLIIWTLLLSNLRNILLINIWINFVDKRWKIVDDPNDTIGEDRMYGRTWAPMCHVISFEKYISKLHREKTAFYEFLCKYIRGERFCMAHINFQVYHKDRTH